MVIDFLPRIFDVYSMLLQLKHKRFFLFFVNRNPHQKSRKKARGRKDWDKQCDRYSNLTALYKTISEDSILININSDNKISFQNVQMCLLTKSS